MTDYRLVLEFDSDDPEFTRGFEAGRIYEALGHRTLPSADFQVHASNRVMMDRIALAAGYRVEQLDFELDGWITLRFHLPS